MSSALDDNKGASKGSQLQQILAWLEAKHRLTALEALRRFGVMALSQRISDLKSEGYPICSQMIKLENGKRVAEYRLITDAPCSPDCKCVPAPTSRQAVAHEVGAVPDAGVSS